jgi:hypothetical protein
MAAIKHKKVFKQLLRRISSGENPLPIKLHPNEKLNR